jgi:hypothetical protein
MGEGQGEGGQKQFSHLPFIENVYVYHFQTDSRKAGCSKGKIRWQILEMRGGKGIDITCYDEVMDKSIRVELKHTLSKSSWNHRLEDIDFVVCWENRWPDFPKPVLVLSEIIKET